MSDQIESHCDDIRGLLSKIEDEEADYLDKIKELEGKANDLETENDDLREEISALNARIESLEAEAGA